jgi:endo-alpha-1,4-polygalactosaminidase (GH114 family)
MELQYKKALEKNNLNVIDLPEDAQTGISEINNVLKAFNMLEKKGGKPTAKSLKKLKAMDKWVYYEILDYLHDTDKNDDDIPFDADDVKDDLTDDLNKDDVKDDLKDDNIEPDALGLKIEAELDGLYQSGKTVYSIEELGNKARETYNVLFDLYQDGEENGIVTTKYSLLEDKDKTYKLKLN